MKHVFITVAVITTVLCGMRSAQAADKYWVCGSSQWDNASCWSSVIGGSGGAGQPQAGDNAYLTQSDSINRTISYSNSAYPSAVLNYLQIKATGSGTVTLLQTMDTLRSNNEDLSYFGGQGIHTQSGGDNIITNSLFVGYYGVGTYNLSGTGNLTAQTQTVGYFGSGSTFNQSGGTNTINSYLTVGSSASSNSSYNQSGGSLTAFGESVGASNTGTGTFSQTGGTNTATGELSLGYYTGTSGNYSLSGTGTLVAAQENVGASGTGSFTQAGGTHTVSGSLSVGENSGSNGVYNLNGGSLSSSYENIGLLGTGTFNQSGGTHTVTVMSVASGSGGIGTYNMHGGTLEAGSIVVNNGGAFNFDGGTLTVGYFSGNLANNGGTLAVSGGGTTIAGSYTQSASGTFSAKVGGPLAEQGQYDILSVSGTAHIDGTLRVILVDDGTGNVFSPHAGEYFDILTADQLQGTYSLLALAVLDPGLVWHVDYLTDAIGTTDVVRLSVQAVPLPPAVWLLGSGLLALVGVGQRRRVNGACIRNTSLLGNSELHA